MPLVPPRFRRLWLAECQSQFEIVQDRKEAQTMNIRYPPFMDATNASLSQRYITTDPFYQMAVATMIGRSSFAAMDAEANSGHSLQDLTPLIPPAGPTTPGP